MNQHFRSYVLFIGNVVVLLLICASCGTTSLPPSVPSVSAHFSTNTMNDLAQLSDLDASGFTVYTAAAVITSTTAAQGSTINGTTLTHDGMKSAASVRYFRSSATAISYVNGPVDVTSIAELFSTTSQASTAYNQQLSWANSETGAVGISTGLLGDESGASEISRVDTSSNSTLVVQFTLLWRLNNLDEILIMRGRYGGTAITDATYTANAIDRRFAQNS